MCDIEPASGLVCLEEEDFSLNGDYSFFFKRRYNNYSAYAGPLGRGWMHPYGVYMFLQAGELYLVDGEARQVLLKDLSRSPRVDLPSEDLIAENTDLGFLLHRGEGQTLTFS